MKNKKLFQEWVKERDEVVKTYDIEAFKVFYRKWSKLGIYTVPLPKNDHVIEISLLKMILCMSSATHEERAEAEKWLIDHGYDTEV